MNKVSMVLWLLPLALDCTANLLVGGSWSNTLSGEAWNQRDQPYFGWTHRFIDTLFFWQRNHCQRQALREAAHGGSVWAAWRHDWSKA